MEENISKIYLRRTDREEEANIWRKKIYFRGEEEQRRKIFEDGKHIFGGGE